MVSVLSAYFRTARVQIAALMYFLLAGALTQMPLFNYLGYEFSALMTIPAAFISGILTIQFIREHRTKPLTRRTWLFVIGDYILVNFLLLLIPLVVIALNAFVIKNCAFGKGLAYFLLLPGITIFFSISLALVIGVLFRRAIMLFSVIVIAILAHIVFVTYTQPQLFAYNFILGFFPGITYDELLSDITPLILYRQFTIIASLSLIALFIILTGSYNQNDTISNNFKYGKRNYKKDMVLWGVVLFCFLVVGSGHFFRHLMGFEYSEQDIQQELGRRTESDHFIYYYQNADYSAEDMFRVKSESEFHFRKVADALNTSRCLHRKISLYIYPNGEWKHRFIGTTNTNIAKPWKGEIHLTKATMATTFRHELVHAMASSFGFPIINASTRMGLNEGLAVAVDWDEGMFTPHQYAASLLREKKLEHAELLFTYTGFALQSSSYAYLVSGSFVRYLIDRFGIERVRLAFPNGSFVITFGETLESLVRDWKAFLKTIDATEIPPETVNALFVQQSIFFKTCAREVAEQNQRAMQAMKVSNYAEAEQEFNAAFDNASTATALRGLFQTLIYQRKYQHVVKRYSELQESSSLRTNPAILMLLADSYYFDQQSAKAMSVYRSIRSMNISESYVEMAALRMQLLLDGLEPDLFHTFSYTGLGETAKTDFIDSVLSLKKSSIALQYIRALLSDTAHQQRLQDYQRVILESSSADLRYFAKLRSADQLYRLSRFEEAKSFYWEAKNDAPTITVSDRLDEKIELCDYRESEQQ